MTKEEAIKYLQQIFPIGGHCWLDERRIEAIGMAVKALQKEPVSEELEDFAKRQADEFAEREYEVGSYDIGYLSKGYYWGCKAGAEWQKQQDQSIIELAEDHAYSAGRTKTIDEIKVALLSEVLPCFMHGGEADEVVAKLDEVLNKRNKL